MRIWVDTDSGTYGDAEFIYLLDLTAAETEEFESMSDAERVEKAIKDGWKI